MGRSANPSRDLHPLHLRTRKSLLAPYSYTFQLSKHIYTTQIFASLTMWDITFSYHFFILIGTLWASISYSPDNHFECMNIRFRSPRNGERKSIKTHYFYTLDPTQIWASKWFLNMVYQNHFPTLYSLKRIIRIDKDYFLQRKKKKDLSSLQSKLLVESKYSLFTKSCSLMLIKIKW